ncbi:MAG: C4-dicarboxylate-specific signal transduction histidine kinase [Myxococcota bacterium]|jgi:C4-dicarboxylate-specific signal transduction histidine kinase
MVDPDPAPKHLLIVDDEPVILQILKAVFENEPYRISCAANGREAKRIIEEQGCHLLLTDKNLPDISGLELLRLAKERDPTTEVIIITGYASIETAIAAMELDAFDYVLKPLNNVFDIRTKARQALEKQHMVLENRRLLSHLQQKNTELEEALHETQALQAELIQSEKLAGIGTLAAGVAHEISSPLFGIMGLAEAIVDETELSLVHEYAGDIVEYCGGIRDIVVELSSYSRTASNEFLTTVDMAHIIKDALRLIERSAPVEGVAFHTSLEEPIHIQARTNEIQQVFVNLIKNAAEAVIERHGEDGGTVHITAGMRRGEAWATVRDNGPGIAEEKLSVVFDPFYTTKPPGKGTGLGLNIVYRILTKYRGTISVESSVGVGTVFQLQLPTSS